MNKLMLSFVALAGLSGSALHAQDLSGTWQGALPAGGKELRIVKLESTKAPVEVLVLDRAERPSEN